MSFPAYEDGGLGMCVTEPVSNPYKLADDVLIDEACGLSVPEWIELERLLREAEANGS